MELAAIRATPAGDVCHVALSDEEAAARSRLASWAHQARWSMRLGQIGSMFFRSEGGEPGPRRLVLGSHTASSRCPLSRPFKLEMQLDVWLIEVRVKGADDRGMRLSR
jgi:hypothetical protein